MSQQPARGDTRRTAETQHIRGLEEAFALVAAAFRAQRWITVAGGRPILMGGAPAEREGALASGLRRLAEPVREIVSGARRSWADGRREAAVAVLLRGGVPAEAAVVRLDDRRTIAEGCVIDLAQPDAGARFAAAFDGAQAALVCDPTPSVRAAVGLILQEHGIGRGRLPLIEIDIRGKSDFRDFLAGSWWLDMDLPGVAADPAARALLTAVQARSIRRAALSEVEQARYAAAAARALSAAGASVREIAARLRVPDGLAVRWLREPPEEGEPDPRREDDQGPTPRQRRAVLGMLRELPALRRVLKPEWRSDRATASEFIGRAQALLAELRAPLRRQRNQEALRESLAGGATLSAAAAEARIDEAEALALLREDAAAGLSALLGRLAAELGADVPEAEILGVRPLRDRLSAAEDAD